MEDLRLGSDSIKDDLSYRSDLIRVFELVARMPCSCPQGTFCFDVLRTWASSRQRPVLF